MARQLWHNLSKMDFEKLSPLSAYHKSQQNTLSVLCRFCPSWMSRQNKLWWYQRWKSKYTQRCDKDGIFKLCDEYVKPHRWWHYPDLVQCILYPPAWESVWLMWTEVWYQKYVKTDRWWHFPDHVLWFLYRSPNSINFRACTHLTESHIICDM